MNKNSLLNQNYICPMGADGVHYTRSVTTQVLVNNGQTVVLGGIYETEYGEFVTKVPVLGDIPFLGVFFRRTQTVSDKAELLIFVTPKILQDGTAIY